MFITEDYTFPNLFKKTGEDFLGSENCNVLLNAGRWVVISDKVCAGINDESQAFVLKQQVTELSSSVAYKK